MKRTVTTSMKKTALMLAAVVVLFSLPCLAAESGWTEDFAAAKKQAAAEHKDLLIDFTGSDWCGWCKKLEKEVFSTAVFKREAPRHFVLVRLDFPRRVQQSAALKAQNRKLMRKYGVRGFPTVILADARGNEYARTGYRRGGAEKYIANLDKLRSKKTIVSNTATTGDKGQAAAKQDNDLWTQDYRKALKKAKAEGKDLLVDFTGSDWCGWCKKLEKEVFSQDAFVKNAPKYFVLVRLDFPRDKSKITPAIQEQNKALAKKFGIAGYPSVYLVDASGKPYAQTGYAKGGAEKYMQSLLKLREVRVKRDEYLKKANTAKNISMVRKAQLLDKALADISPELLGKFYKTQVNQIIRLDANNKAGLKSKYELFNLKSKIRLYMRKRSYAMAIATIDKILKEFKLDGQGIQDMYFLRSEAQFYSKDKPGAKASLEKALQAAPKGNKAELIKSIIKRLFAGK